MTKLLTLSSLVSAALLLTACHREPADTSATNRTPIGVKVLSVTESNVPANYEATGTVQARTTSVLASKVMGTVRAVNVHAGDRVSSRQVLVVLDAKDLDAQVDSARAAQEGAQSSLAGADSEVASAKANLELAEATFQRMKTLYDQRSLSNQEFDQANAKVKAARASFDMANARRRQGESAIAQSQASLRSAGINRDYSRIVAPFSGLVTESNVEPGTLAVPGNPLLTVERTGSYRLEAAVTESKLASVHVGEKVDVTVDGISGQMAGLISEIVPTVDPGSRSYTAKIDLPNRSSLRSGLFGRADFQLGSRKAITIPAAAVTTNGQLESVLVVEAGVARLRIITTGGSNNSLVSVLSGLQAGDELIYPVPGGLLDGSPVQVRR